MPIFSLYQGQISIQVYFCSGDAAMPWHVGLHDGTAISRIFQQFNNPKDASQYAHRLGATLPFPVKLPEWLPVQPPADFAEAVAEVDARQPVTNGTQAVYDEIVGAELCEAPYQW